MSNDALLEAAKQAKLDTALELAKDEPIKAVMLAFGSGLEVGIVAGKRASTRAFIEALKGLEAEISLIRGVRERFERSLISFDTYLENSAPKREQRLRRGDHRLPSMRGCAGRIQQR